MDTPTIVMDSDALQAFLLLGGRQLRGRVAYFKYHDDQDQAFVIPNLEDDRVLAVTAREAVQFLLIAYDEAMVRHQVDKEGWQYWSLKLDEIDTTQNHEQVRLGLHIARLVEASSAPSLRRPRKK